MKHRWVRIVAIGVTVSLPPYADLGAASGVVRAAEGEWVVVESSCGQTLTRQATSLFPRPDAEGDAKDKHQGTGQCLDGNGTCP